MQKNTKLMLKYRFSNISNTFREGTTQSSKKKNELKNLQLRNPLSPKLKCFGSCK